MVRLILFACIGVMLVERAVAAESADLQYSVRFLPTLGVKSPDEVDGALDKAWGPLEFLREEWRGEAHFDEPILSTEALLDDQGGYRIRTRRVTTCGDVFAARAAGFGFGTARPAYEPNERTSDHCHLLRFLKEAKPSAQSFIHDLKLDETIPDLLPAVVPDGDPASVLETGGGEAPLPSSPSWSEQRALGTCHAHDEPRSGSAVAPCPDTPAPIVRVESPFSTAYLDPVGFGTPGEIADLNEFDPFFEVLTLTLLAFADFDGDDIEDVLLRADQTVEYATQGTYAGETRGLGPSYWFSVWLLTRLGPEAPLTMVRHVSFSFDGR